MQPSHQPVIEFAYANLSPAWRAVDAWRYFAMETHDECQEREWRALYAALSVLLAKHGKQNVYGDGDFWIVDDNDGSSQHKVRVTRASFLTRPLALAVQRRLRIHSLAWEVLFFLDKPEL